MRRFFIAASLVVSAALLFSFTNDNRKIKPNSIISGFWITGNPSNANEPYHMKVFNEDGSYYNVAYEGGEIVITHKGKYKVLDESHYKEKVTNLRFNAAWDLKNKEFINNYELSKDKKLLVLSGVVYSKDGRDSLRWSHQYRRVQIPE